MELASPAPGERHSSSACCGTGSETVSASSRYGRLAGVGQLERDREHLVELERRRRARVRRRRRRRARRACRRRVCATRGGTGAPNHVRRRWTEQPGPPGVARCRARARPTPAPRRRAPPRTSGRVSEFAVELDPVGQRRPQWTTVGAPVDRSTTTSLATPRRWIMSTLVGAERESGDEVLLQRHVHDQRRQRDHDRRRRDEVGVGRVLAVEHRGSTT